MNKMNAVQLYMDEKYTNKNWKELTKDACDYCGTDILLCSSNGHDIFLEGWNKSLACVDCCSKYSLIELWELDNDTGNEFTERFEASIEKMIQSQNLKDEAVMFEELEILFEDIEDVDVRKKLRRKFAKNTESYVMDFLFTLDVEVLEELEELAEEQIIYYDSMCERESSIVVGSLHGSISIALEEVKEKVDA
jgi:hypothetical protein